MLKDISKDNFESEVLQSNTPVLVDFWAEGCAPCKDVVPVLEKLAQEQEKVCIVKLDITQNQEIAMRYQVMSIPTLILFERGDVKQRIVGNDPEVVKKAVME